MANKRSTSLELKVDDKSGDKAKLQLFNTIITFKINLLMETSVCCPLLVVLFRNVKSDQNADT